MVSPAPVPTIRICGTTPGPGSIPIRVADIECASARTDVRWYEADPMELDTDDFTDIGEPLNDDYLGPEYDVGPSVGVTPRTRATPRASSTPAPRSTRAATPTTRRR